MLPGDRFFFFFLFPPYQKQQQSDSIESVVLYIERNTICINILFIFILRLFPQEGKIC